MFPDILITLQKVRAWHKSVAFSPSLQPGMPSMGQLAAAQMLVLQTSSSACSPCQPTCCGQALQCYSSSTVTQTHPLKAQILLAALW